MSKYVNKDEKCQNMSKKNLKDVNKSKWRQINIEIQQKYEQKISRNVKKYERM